MALSGYVYILTETTTGKKYVGRTTNPKARKSSHMIALRGGYHINKEMQADFNKYHGDYRFEVIGYDDHLKGTGFWSLEKQTMIRLKTYDPRYGYNSNDKSMTQWLHKCRMYTEPATTQRNGGKRD